MDAEFFKLTKEVRKAQRKYFAARAARRNRPPKEIISQLLEKSKELEKQLDEEISKIELENQPKLFQDSDFE